MDFDIRRKITNLIARYEAEEITYSELSNFVANIAEHGNAESYLFVAHVLNELPSPLSQRLAKEVSSRAKQIDRVWKGIEANQDT
jgi:hypothetical protein